MNFKFSIIPFNKELLFSYQTFARKAWGSHSYQSTHSYIQWLYEKNPSINKNPEDFLVAIDANHNVIACVHLLRVPWLINTEIIEIPAIHNLFVQKDYRKGLGGMLILAAKKRNIYSLVPGTGPDLAKGYKKLKWHELETYWYRRIFSPILLVSKLTLAKMSLFKNYFESKQVKFQIENLRADDLVLTSSPNDEILKKIERGFQKNISICQKTPLLTADWIKWRFFDKNGPRHVLCGILTQNDELDFLIISVGLRHGILIARLIDCNYSEIENLQKLLQHAQEFCRKNHIYCFLIFTANKSMRTDLEILGWKTYQPSPSTFLLCKKELIFNNYMFNGSAGDFGLESFGVKQI